MLKCHSWGETASHALLKDLSELMEQKSTKGDQRKAHPRVPWGGQAAGGKYSGKVSVWAHPGHWPVLVKCLS